MDYIVYQGHNLSTSTTNIITYNDYAHYYTVIDYKDDGGTGSCQPNVKYISPFFEIVPEKKVDLTPKFKKHDMIVYLSYLKQSKQLAVHCVKGLNEKGYVIKSAYGHEDFVIEYEKNDDFIEFGDFIEEYPELVLSIKEVNGPEKDFGKIIQKYNKNRKKYKK